MYTTLYQSPFGEIVLAESEGALVGLWFTGQKYFPSLENAVTLETACLQQTKEWLGRYFAKEKPLPTELPLKPAGSSFRQIVWSILCTIPYGQVMTYGEIARITAEAMGTQTMSAQAIGGAVGHNPISILIPCHRVVGSHGNLTGYAGGILRKLQLLQHEGIPIENFMVPKHTTAPAVHIPSESPCSPSTQSR